LPVITKPLENNEFIKKAFVKSAQGTNNLGMKKINQDSYLVKRNLLGLENYSIFSVFDGHGIYLSNP
jgi:serine/threonine protein phosphatase PrpC